MDGRVGGCVGGWVGGWVRKRVSLFMFTDCIYTDTCMCMYIFKHLYMYMCMGVSHNQGYHSGNPSIWRSILGSPLWGNYRVCIYIRTCRYS